MHVRTYMYSRQHVRRSNIADRTTAKVFLSSTVDFSTPGMVEIRHIYVKIKQPFFSIKPKAGVVWATQNHREVDNATDGWLYRVIL